MRIALLTHEPFYPPSGGGSAEAVYVVRELVGREHEVHLFCPQFERAAEVSKEFGIQTHAFTGWAMGRYTALRNLKYLVYPLFLERMVRRISAQLRFDLVLSQHAISAVAAGRLKRRLGTTVIMNFLDYLTGFMETWPVYLAPPALLKVLKRFELSMPVRYGADGVLTVSDTLKDLFAESGYPAENVRSIYYGFDADLFPFRGAVPAGRPVIVMHGSLDQHHLRTIALEAWRMVVRARPEMVLRIVGHRTAALESFLRRAGAGPPGQIECTGFVPYREIAGHLGTAAVGIVPYEESIGAHCAFVAKTVEYLAVGLPVVSTPLASSRRYFGDEPRVIFSQFDGQTFGEAVLRCLAEPAESGQEAARRASERVRHELDWRVISARAVDFMEATVAKGGAR